MDRTFGTENEFYLKMGFKEVSDALMKKGLKKKGQSSIVAHEECFGVKHYAGDVMYTVRDFVPKSRDGLTVDLTQVETRMLPHFPEALHPSRSRIRKLHAFEFGTRPKFCAPNLELRSSNSNF